MARQTIKTAANFFFIPIRFSKTFYAYLFVFIGKWTIGIISYAYRMNPPFTAFPGQQIFAERPCGLHSVIPAPFPCNKKSRSL